MPALLSYALEKFRANGPSQTCCDPVSGPTQDGERRWCVRVTVTDSVSSSELPVTPSHGRFIRHASGLSE